MHAKDKLVERSCKSFALLNAQMRADDIRRAENLRKSRSIANVKPGTGPRIAR